MFNKDAKKTTKSGDTATGDDVEQILDEMAVLLKAVKELKETLVETNKRLDCIEENMNRTRNGEITELKSQVNKKSDFIQDLLHHMITTKQEVIMPPMYNPRYPQGSYKPSGTNGSTNPNTAGPVGKLP